MPPLPPRKAVDPTGAGDTFVAAWLAARMLVGDGWRPQAVAAQRCGSLAVMSTVPRRHADARPICARRCSGCAIYGRLLNLSARQTRQPPLQITLNGEHGLAPGSRSSGDRAAS